MPGTAAADPVIMQSAMIARTATDRAATDRAATDRAATDRTATDRTAVSKPALATGRRQIIGPSAQGSAAAAAHDGTGTHAETGTTAGDSARAPGRPATQAGACMGAGLVAPQAHQIGTHDGYGRSGAAAVASSRSEECVVRFPVRDRDPDAVSSVRPDADPCRVAGVAEFGRLLA